MIDTYFDRADAATRFFSPVHEDPRYWRGVVHKTVIDRNVAKAKEMLQAHINSLTARHLQEIGAGILLGGQGSIYTTQGKL